MSITYVYYDDVAAGIRFNSDTYNADYYIDSGAVLGSTDSTAIYVRGTYSDVFVRGAVVGSNYGMLLGDSINDYGNSVHIAEGGAVMGVDYGIGTYGSATVTNKGDIDSSYVGIYAREGNYNRSTVTNDGTVSASTYGIYGELGGSSSLTVVNRGVISGNSYGVVFSEDTGASSRVTNFGTIEGGQYGYLGGSGADVLLNRGQLLGAIDMGSGNDRFDNRGGHVEETVYGGYGDDTFLAGAEAEEFNGGEGIDTLDFQTSTGLRVSLTDSSGTGRAEGDVYTGFERILGSRAGGDTLIGDAAANTLEGLGGNDTLSGMGGDDRLVGGLGADRLSGGAGNDVFMFNKADEGKDVIADFHNVVGDNDVFYIAVAGFGGGLVAGALAPTQLVTRADNLAQDADDRFIFRTTDKTLWFDLDGKGGAAAVLLADLQDSARITSADIMLI